MYKLIYEQMCNAHIDAMAAPKFMMGYAFYRTMKNQTDWVDVPQPLRLAYRCRHTNSMVILPFLLSGFVKRIWGIEFNGMCFALKAHNVNCWASNRDVANALDRMSSISLEDKTSEVRPYLLPTVPMLNQLLKQEEAFASVVSKLQQYAVKVDRFDIGKQWVRGTEEDTPMVTYRFGNAFVNPYQEQNAMLRPVLQTDHKLDCFCSVNEYGFPNMPALRKCLHELSK